MTKNEIIKSLGKAPLSGKDMLPFLRDMDKAALAAFRASCGLAPLPAKTSKENLIKSTVAAADKNEFHFKLQFTVHPSTGAGRHCGTPLYYAKARSYVTDTAMREAGLDPLTGELAAPAPLMPCGSSQGETGALGLDNDPQPPEDQI